MNATTTSDRYSSHLNIPYTPSELNPSRQVLDLHLPTDSNSSNPLIVYIHGGAWRSDSKDDLTPTLIPKLLAATEFKYPIANLEYRIAPTNDPHPAQITDVISALTLLTSDTLLSFELTKRWNRKEIYLVGHSAGAFMALEIVLQDPNPFPLFDVPLVVRKAIQNIALVDGIFDLRDLLLEYPSYLGAFVAEVFGNDPAVYERESPSNWGVHEMTPYLNYLVLHSRDDELLSLRQSRLIVNRLQEKLGIYDVSDEPGQGRVEGVPGDLEFDFDSIKGKHEVLPHTDYLPNRLAKWIAASEALINRR